MGKSSLLVPLAESFKHPLEHFQTPMAITVEPTVGKELIQHSLLLAPDHLCQHFLQPLGREQLHVSAVMHLHLVPLLSQQERIMFKFCLNVLILDLKMLNFVLKSV